MATTGAKSKPGNQRYALTRRQFMANIARSAGGATLFGLGLAIYSNKAANAVPAQSIRPPGTLAEAEFLAACIRCGLCVRDCPFDILKLATLGEDIPLGTPYFVAREAACEMCEDIPCVKACPTGALDQNLTDIDQSRMGLAVLIDQAKCLAFLGLRCEVCYNICPIRGDAILIEQQHIDRTGKHAKLIPVVNAEACTGCGKCEQACVLEGEAAIKVLPVKLASAQRGDFYRLGWEEKARAGNSLVTPDIPHQYNLPRGSSYDHAGAGLREFQPPESNPAD